MTKKDLSFDEKVEFIANFIGDNFLRVARALRELQDEQPDIFLKVAELAGLSNRKAYALARISRQFDDLGASEGAACESQSAEAMPEAGSSQPISAWRSTSLAVESGPPLASR